MRLERVREQHALAFDHLPELIVAADPGPAHLVFDRDHVLQVGSAHQHLRRIAALMQPLKVPVASGEEADREIGVVADIGEIVVELVLAGRVKRVGMAEQDAFDADLLRLLRHDDDVLRRIEGAVHQEEVPALRLVDGDLHEAAIFRGGGAAFRHQQRAPEAVLDVAPDVVPDRLLVESFEIGGETGQDDVAHAYPFCECTLLRFCSAIFHRFPPGVTEKQLKRLLLSGHRLA